MKNETAAAPPSVPAAPSPITATSDTPPATRDGIAPKSSPSSPNRRATPKTCSTWT
ncbi:MAG: hypothetical protein M5U34_12615 [Chloroflexi bacterium]|nr:hypothetical protein [Chloroflexota bacterium]